MSAAVDIGHGVSIEQRCLQGDTVPCGVAYKHPDGKGGICGGWVPYKSLTGWPPNGWDVLSRDPLTLAPSLLCRICGHHGFIREGKWVPA